MRGYQGGWVSILEGACGHCRWSADDVCFVGLDIETGIRSGGIGIFHVDRGLYIVCRLVPITVAARFSVFAFVHH